MQQKVVWIVNEYNGPTEKTSRQTVLARLLSEKGYDVYLFCGSAEQKGGDNLISDSEKYKYVEGEEAKGYIIKTIDYHRGYERIIAALQFQKRLWKYRSKFPKPDIIVSDFAGLFGYVFLKWKKRYNTKIIYDILDLWPEGFIEMGYIKKGSLVAKYLYHLEHKTYSKANHIIFSMQGGRDYIIDKGWNRETGGDVDTRNIGYLNNGVDLEKVDQQRKMYHLDDVDLDSEKYKVIYLGSISAMNGLDVLVETARILQERNRTDIIILVYGYGNQEEKLKERVSELGLKNIKFKGKLDVEYGANLLSRGDLNIFTFRDSPLWKYGISPNKLFMYFASGKPVLSMIRPNYDLVEEKEAGISVRNDPTLIADAIERFSRMDHNEYETYCRNARKTAEEYDYKNLVKVLIDRIEG